MELSKTIDINQLLQYRNDVAKRTRTIVAGLTEEQIKQPVSKEAIDKILKIHGVTTQENSIWLLDYWGSKDIGGLLLMAPTRHVMLHLNDCCKWKESFKLRRSFFRT